MVAESPEIIFSVLFINEYPGLVQYGETQERRGGQKRLLDANQ